jgi:hypothetical protein
MFIPFTHSSTHSPAIIEAGQDHSLEAIDITPEQALNDLCALKEMIHTRRPEARQGARCEKLVGPLASPNIHSIQN